MTRQIEQTRRELKGLLRKLLDAWEGKADLPVLSSHFTAKTYQYGSLKSATDLQDAFKTDHNNYDLHVKEENVYIAGQKNKAAISAYLIGKLNNDQEKLTFSGQIILDLTKIEQEWVIDYIRLINATDGKEKPSHWVSSLNIQKRWEPGDDTPIIIPELDSPWRKFPDNAFGPTNKDEALQDLYTKYAWGIDMLDWSNLADVIAEDAETDLMPMGQQKGKRNVYGQLRGFRNAATYLQHIGEVIDIHWFSETEAELFVGRLFSQQDYTETNQRLYGARYKMKARLEKDGVWRYTYMNYQPGWFVLQ